MSSCRSPLGLGGIPISNQYMAANDNSVFSRTYQFCVCVRLSSVCLSVCNVCMLAKRCIVPKNCLKKQGNSLWEIEWSRDRWRHVTLKGQGHGPIGSIEHLSLAALRFVIFVRLRVYLSVTFVHSTLPRGRKFIFSGKVTPGLTLYWMVVQD